MGKKDRKRNRDWPTLPVLSYAQIPITEVSGLAVAPLPRGTSVVAVGDHGPEVAVASLESGGVLDWDVIDLSTLEAPEGAPAFDQAEAVAADGNRQAVILIEDPALLLVLDTVDRRLTHFFELTSTDDVGPSDAWTDDPTSRGEGLVLLRDGHVLVLKEKRPAGLLEFGPAEDPPLGIAAHTLHRPGTTWSAPSGRELVALAWWPVDDTLADLSDAEIGPDGSLYVLSDKTNAIGQLELPVAVGAPVRYAHVWALDEGVEKAEGLTFLPDGSAFVAVDRSDLGRNLVCVPPREDWPSD